MQRIAFIPVRGGSKSIPQKNVKNMAGRPLVHWTVMAACECAHIDRVVIATDDDIIASVVAEIKNSKIQIYRRKSENAQDQSSTESVMFEYIEQAALQEQDMFVLIQATNPLLQSHHLSEAFALIEKKKQNSLLSVVRNKRFFWNEAGKPLNYDFNNRPRRQDFAGCLMENGSFYISKVGDILTSRCRLSSSTGAVLTYEMPEASGFEIDEPSDWVIIEELLRQQLLSRSHSFEQNKKNVKLFLTDVDGVLTDAGMYYTENGDEIKKFHTLDGMGLQMLKKRGIPVGIITSENRELNRRRAEKLKLDYLFQGAVSKLEIAKTLCQQLGLSLEEVCYIGDDVNDLDLLREVGWAACPASAVQVIKDIPGIHILNKSGGQGVVRELAECVLATLA